MPPQYHCYLISNISLDRFEALSMAGTVIQLVDFSSKSERKNLYISNHGILGENVEIQRPPPFVPSKWRTA